jgi:hypothetical protein
MAAVVEVRPVVAVDIATSRVVATPNAVLDPAVVEREFDVDPVTVDEAAKLATFEAMTLADVVAIVVVRVLLVLLHIPALQMSFLLLQFIGKLHVNPVVKHTW